MMEGQLQLEQKASQRLSATQRFERLVFVVAFAGLALTGLSQRFAAESWGNALIVLLGGIESARILHRFFAILLIAITIYHLIAVGYGRLVLGNRAALFPGIRDWRGLVGRVFSNLGLKRAGSPDTQFALRIRYLVLFISILILIVTGLILWNPVAVTNSLPGETIPVARSVHSDHALLLVVFIVIWQFLIVFLWHPKPDADARVQAVQPLSAVEINRRRRPFFVAAILISGLLAVVLIWFISFERTAINTVPRRQEAVFAPQMMPEAGDANVGAALWSTLRCAFCHGEQAAGGANGEPALRQSDLTLDTFYDRVRNGKGEMPSFSPEELPDGYLLHLWTWLSETPE